MLEILRRKGVNKTILWIIAIVVILSFGIFADTHGPPERRCRETGKPLQIALYPADSTRFRPSALAR